MGKKWMKLAVLSSLLLLSLVGCTSANSGAKEKQAAQEKSPQPTVLYVTRHGKTMLNTLDRVQGWADTPLTPEGIAVAADLGNGLKKEKVEFKAVYSSDLGRAK